MFQLKLGSRRQIKYLLHKEEVLSHINILAKEENKTVAHGDTLEYLLSRLQPENLASIRTKMMHRLIRMKVLENSRLLNKYYLIAVDGTGVLSFSERHCDKCLTKTSKKTGKTTYYHPVLEAKLVTPQGLALSIETEFIENPIIDEASKKSEEKVKQDCETKAFHRLAEKLKKNFPQLNICLTLDGIYASKPVFDTCEKYHWKFITVFKQGSMPATYTEFESLMKIQKENKVHQKINGIVQDFNWVNNLNYKNHSLQIIQCVETKQNIKTKKFVWITNISVNKNNCATIGNLGGRIRWKIENEGFNAQKNGGYNLEHAYSKNENAGKNYYFLLQIAHIINQLMEKGSLIKNILKTYGSLKNFSFILLESIRNTAITKNMLDRYLQKPFQVRFDTS